MPRSGLGQSLLLSTMLVAAFAATAFAEDDTSYVAAPDGQAHITLNTNRFVPAPSDNSEQASKAEADGRRMIYDLAGHECGILRDTIASECRIQSINNISFGCRRTRIRPHGRTASMSTPVSSCASCRSDRRRFLRQRQPLITFSAAAAPARSIDRSLDTARNLTPRLASAAARSAEWQ
jgi:hypothetical protein